MSIPGKKVVFGFYGSMGILALIGLVIVLWVRAQPVVQTEQRTMARLLSNAYQKYRYDMNDWPRDAFDAAVNFRSENATLSDKVKEAEGMWGLKVTMIEPTSESPQMHVVFEKPSLLEFKYSLYNRNRGRRK